MSSTARAWRLLYASAIFLAVALVAVKGFVPSSSSSSSPKPRSFHRFAFQSDVLRRKKFLPTTVRRVREIHHPPSNENAIQQKMGGSPTILRASNSATLFGRTKSTTTSKEEAAARNGRSISALSAFATKMGMIAFIVSMCLALPIVLLPQAMFHRLGFITRIRQQQLALSSGQFCARWLLRLIPFCNVTAKIVKFDHDGKRCCTNTTNKQQDRAPQPSIWVCNHTSSLDVFILLAKDLELRGKWKRPIKIVYVSV